MDMNVDMYPTFIYIFAQFLSLAFIDRLLCPPLKGNYDAAQ